MCVEWDHVAVFDHQGGGHFAEQGQSRRICESLTTEGLLDVVPSALDAVFREEGSVKLLGDRCMTPENWHCEAEQRIFQHDLVGSWP